MHTRLSKPFAFILPTFLATLRTDRPTDRPPRLQSKTEGQGATSALGPARNRGGRQEPHETQQPG